MANMPVSKRFYTSKDAGAGRAGSTAKNTSKCAHCERTMNDYAGGHSRGYHNELLCHPNADNRPDCYRLVTIYKHATPCASKTCYEDHSNFLDYIGSIMEETIK